MKKTKLNLIFVFILVSGFFTTGFQDDQPNEPNIMVTQIDNSEFPKVTVYLSVVDAEGNPVKVDASRLVIKENGKAIKSGQIEGVGEVGALTTLLVTDASGSMNNGSKLESAKAAAHEYVAQMRSGDQVGLVIFNTEFTVIQKETANHDKLTSGINSIRAKDNTAMYDALLKSIKTLDGIGGRKAIIVLTDGLDNISQATLADVIARIGPTGLSISTIGLGEPGESKGAVTALDEVALKDLAAQAGGVYGYANDQKSLRRLYQRYAVAMQSEYVITYNSPAVLRDGVNRSLTVSLQDAALSEAVSIQDTQYNPGGLVPEVAEPAPWRLFGILTAGLLILLLLPSVVALGGKIVGLGKGGLKRKPKPRIKFID
jgi:VWFA-related protein